MFRLEASPSAVNLTPSIPLGNKDDFSLSSNNGSSTAGNFTTDTPSWPAMEASTSQVQSLVLCLVNTLGA